MYGETTLYRVTFGAIVLEVYAVSFGEVIERAESILKWTGKMPSDLDSFKVARLYGCDYCDQVSEVRNNHGACAACTKLFEEERKEKL